MAGLSAGEVFITLSVKGQGVKPALQKASSLLRNFGKQLNSLSVATGNLIADGVKFAFRKLGEVASYAFEKAKLDPRTAKDTARFEEAVAKLDRSFSRLAASMSSVVLPTFINVLNNGLTPFVDKLNEMFFVLEQSGSVAALQTGNVSSAFEIMFKQIQIANLEGSSALLSDWEKMTKLMRMSWEGMALSLPDILGKVLSQVGNEMTGAIAGIKLVSPALANQLSEFERIGKAFQETGTGLNLLTTQSAIQTATTKTPRERFMEQTIAELQSEIDKLKNQFVNQFLQERETRDKKFKADATLGTNFLPTMVSGSSSAFALMAGGAVAEQKPILDLLKETREQKEIAKKNLQQLEIIAKGGMVFQ
jgi:hypothetical protein